MSIYIRMINENEDSGPTKKLSGTFNPAIFADAVYEMVKSGNAEERIKRINDREDIKKSGYVAVQAHSGRDVVVFVNEAEKKIIIAHRGTNAGKSTVQKKQDLTADLSFALGREEHNKFFKKRTKATKKILKNYPEEEGYSVMLVGHSYGSMSASQSMLDKKVRDRVDVVHGYNGGTSPFSKEVKGKIKKELDDKVIHHRTNNDIISQITKPKFGKTLNYKEKKTKKHKKIPLGLSKTIKTLDQLNTHSIKQFL